MEVYQREVSDSAVLAASTKKGKKQPLFRGGKGACYV